jgi:dolichol-phosphate mannosyltransferase
MKSLVIVPTYNEKDNIRDLVRAIFQSAQNLDVLIVDDNSPDGTGIIADEMAQEDSRIHVIHRPGKLGLGTAYVRGFKWALEKGYDAVVQMDADFSHDPGDIPRLLKTAEEYDLVIGSRYTNGISVVNWPLERLILSYFANIYRSE